MNIADLRKDYQKAALDIADVALEPFAQFQKWFQEAVAAQLPEPNAMTLSTIAADQTPDARVVLLKGIENNGFIFYTNYNSKKGEQLAFQPVAALTFLWLELERQVRIKGTVEKLSQAMNEAYFNSRPRGSQIGAWASPQSQIIQNRAVLEQRFEEFNQKFAQTNPIPLPAFWGGYIVKPYKVEFWQGRSSRMHDRILYEKDATNGSWKISRLAP